jgi:hypothetical protein
MNAIARLGAVGIALLIGCHSGMSYGPGSPCPCRAPLTCVQGVCTIVEAPISDADAASDTGDAMPGGSTSSAGAGGSIGGTAGDQGTGGFGGMGGMTGSVGAADGRGSGGDSGVDASAGTGNAAGTSSDGGTAGPGGIGGAAGAGGAGERRPPPPPGTCNDSAVSVACPTPPENPGCAQIFCGARLWENGFNAFDGLIKYRIDDPHGMFSDTYKKAIGTVAQAWQDASEGLVRIVECATCRGRVVVVVPGTGDGVVDSTKYEEVLPMPVNAEGAPPLHVIAHQWGHVMGLGHTYERADRDRYVRFDPAIWCGAQRAGLPPTCAYGPDQPGVPRVASDTFGVYDEKSKMNGFAVDGICGSAQPDPTSGTPTDSDGSAVEELYFGHTGGWLPFQPIGRSMSRAQPLDYQLAPGIDPVGSPAITAWTPPAVEVFVRGTDDAVYTIRNVLAGPLFRQWSPWETVATGVRADPAAVFADADTLYLAVRAHVEDSIRLRARTKGTWGAWASLGAPAAGAASAPAIAIRGGELMMVLVRGNDGLLYSLSCTDPATLCAASAGRPKPWTALPPLPPGASIGKPNAAFLTDGRLFVTAAALDGSPWLIGSDSSGSEFGDTFWIPLSGIDLMDDDPDPTIGVTVNGDNIGFYARGASGRLINASIGQRNFNLGGIVASGVGTTAALDGQLSVYIAALINDHGHPGVWVKYYSAANGSGYFAPCNYNAQGTCNQCGCDIPNGPACNY